jgi:molecular chaperone DnaJ
VTTVNVATWASCATCGGSGSRPGTMPVVCPRCGGAGVINDNQGLFSLSTPCPECGGRGTKVVDPCPTCFGTGRQRHERKVKVRIPAGVADGQRIKVKGHGEPGRNGGPNGDLYVTVEVAPHPLFGRRGADLTLTVPITFTEAALGAQITVPSLDKPVTLATPSGTSSGKRFRVAGRGSTGNETRRPPRDRRGLRARRVDRRATRSVEALAKVTATSPRSYLGV